MTSNLSLRCILGLKSLRIMMRMLKLRILRTNLPWLLILNLLKVGNNLLTWQNWPSASSIICHLLINWAKLPITNLTISGSSCWSCFSWCYIPSWCSLRRCPRSRCCGQDEDAPENVELDVVVDNNWACQDKEFVSK